MSNGGIIYESKADVPQIGGIQIRPISVPDLHSGQGYEALEQFGQAGLAWAQQVKAAQEEKSAANAQVTYITELDKAERTAERDPDYANASKNFDDQAQALEDQMIAGANLDAEGTAKLRRTLRPHTIAARGRIQAS